MCLKLELMVHICIPVMCERDSDWKQSFTFYLNKRTEAIMAN